MNARRLPLGVRDVRLALGVVVGMLLAGVVLPLASPPERNSGDTLAVGGPSGAPGTAAPQGDRPTGTGPDAGLGLDSPDPLEVEHGTANADPHHLRTGDRSGTEHGGDRTGGASQPRSASDQGVTSDTITIGISLLDLGTLERTGMVAANGSVEERRRMWELLLSDINEAGGAAGRTLQAVFVQHDPIGDPDSPAKNCRRLAEDHRVFAIVPETGWTAPAAVCSTRQHGLPTFPYDGYDLSVYAQSGGLLFTATGMNDRVLYDEVNVLHERGLLRGRTIGLVTVEGTQAPERTQIPALRSLGYRLAHHSHLSDDLSTAQSQIPVELQRMRANNVDFIIWAGGPLYPNVWITQAQRMGYNPTYSFSSLMSGTDDFAIQAVSGQIDGFAWDPRRRVERNGNRPEGQLDRQCTQRVAQGTGVALAADRQADLYWNAVVACSTLRAIVDALNASGPNPTRQTFAAAVANLGQRQDLETGPADVGGSWRPGKPDAPDFVQEMRHDPGCRCWRPHGNWIEMRLLPG